MAEITELCTRAEKVCSQSYCLRQNVPTKWTDSFGAFGACGHQRGKEHFIGEHQEGGHDTKISCEVGLKQMNIESEPQKLMY